MLRSDGSPLRDYLHVDDAVDAYLAIAERLHDPSVAGEAWNVSCEQPQSVLEMTQRVLAAAGRGDLEPVVLGGGPPRDPEPVSGRHEAARPPGLVPVGGPGRGPDENGALVQLPPGRTGPGPNGLAPHACPTNRADARSAQTSRRNPREPPAKTLAPTNSRAWHRICRRGAVRCEGVRVARPCARLSYRIRLECHTWWRIRPLAGSNGTVRASSASGRSPDHAGMLLRGAPHATTTPSSDRLPPPPRHDPREQPASRCSTTPRTASASTTSSTPASQPTTSTATRTCRWATTSTCCSRAPWSDVSTVMWFVSHRYAARLAIGATAGSNHLLGRRFYASDGAGHVRSPRGLRLHRDEPRSRRPLPAPVGLGIRLIPRARTRRDAAAAPRPGLHTATLRRAGYDLLRPQSRPRSLSRTAAGRP